MKLFALFIVCLGICTRDVARILRYVLFPGIAKVGGYRAGKSRKVATSGLTDGYKQKTRASVHGVASLWAG